MNLHLLWDEKISARIINLFESVFPRQNTYIIWTNISSKPKYVSEDSNIYIIDDYTDYPKINYESFSKVIIHGMDHRKALLCMRCISNDKPIFWILWGVELYNKLLFEHGYQLYYQKPPFTFREKVSLFFKQSLKIVGGTSKIMLELFKNRKVTMVSSLEEYTILKSYYPTYTKYLKNSPEFFYYPIDEVLGEELIKKEANGNLIFVGNSCSWTNNHCYVFEKLKGIDLKDKRILTPLSYGGDLNYQIKVINTGKNYFHEKYEALTDFLPLSKFNELMTHANVCIYGNWRQEAFGNIIISLYLGAKVFLSVKSPLVEILRNKDLLVFTLESLDYDSLHKPLTEEEKRHNRDVLIDNYNWNRLQNITASIFC